MSTTVDPPPVDISGLSDEELLKRAESLASEVRERTADLIESLTEIDRRKLFRGFSYTSLFEYCVYKLRMSDAAAYRRIRAARAIQAYPSAGALLRAGKITLESLTLLHPFLNDVDAGALLAEASGKRVWEVERLVAGRRTEAPRRDVVRFTALAPEAPAPATAEELFVQAPHKLSAPLEPQPLSNSLEARPQIAPSADSRIQAAPSQVARAAPRVRIAFTAEEEFYTLLRRTQAVMRHKYPDGRLERVFRDALEALLRKQTPWDFRAAAPKPPARTGRPKGRETSR